MFIIENKDLFISIFSILNQNNDPKVETFLKGN